MPARKDKNHKKEHVNKLSPMITTGEACRILCIHSNTLRRWSERGLIVAYRTGPRGDRRFKRDDVVALLVEVTRDDRDRFIN